jgi:hypothetical protein
MTERNFENLIECFIGKIIMTDEINITVVPYNRFYPVQLFRFYNCGDYSQWDHDQATNWALNLFDRINQ